MSQEKIATQYRPKGRAVTGDGARACSFDALLCPGSFALRASPPFPAAAARDGLLKAETYRRRLEWLNCEDAE